MRFFRGLINALGLTAGAIILATLVFLGTCHAQQTGTYSNFRNILIGGDFSTNPYQRGTASVTGITSTATYGPDRWFGFGGGSSSVTLARTATSATLAGVSQALSLQRAAANADTTKICAAQIIETPVAQQFQGQTMTLSWYAQAGANFSAALSQMNATVVTGTGTNQAASNLIAATWTNQANASNALYTISATGFQRQQVTFTVPSAETQIAVELCFTPVGTAGTTDSIILSDIQLEQSQSNCLTNCATPFENRPAQVELALAQRYYYQITETATITPRAQCHVTTANSIMQCGIQFPVPMRAAPTATFTAGFAGFTTTAETTATNCSALATDSTVVFLYSPLYGQVACTLTSSTIAVGLSMTLVDNSGGGLMKFTAEF